MDRDRWMQIKEKWLKKDQLLILVLAGVLLLVISLPVGGKEEEQGQQDSTQTQLSFAGVTETETTYRESANQDTVGGVSMDYEKEMEQRLLGILEAMEGVGEARVMITLKASQELLLDKNSNGNLSETEETDAAGGSRYILQQDSQESTVLITRDGEDSPICIKTIYPEVEGVVVAAQGAGTGSISKQISEMVQVLFGIDAHRVKIVKLE